MQGGFFAQIRKNGPLNNAKQQGIVHPETSVRILGDMLFGQTSQGVIPDGVREMIAEQGYTGVRANWEAIKYVSVRDTESHEVYNEMAAIPAFPISFELNAELSALSWDAYDNRLPLADLRKKYAEIIARPKMDPLCILFLVAFANASFCALFGGDWTSRGIVFSATLIGFYIRQVMQKRHINHYIVFMVSAFAASLAASSALTLDTTSEVAIATSVLFLVPGVPLLNGVIDIVEGHVITGCSRLIQALLLVLCIAVGLSFTLMLVRNSLL